MKRYEFFQKILTQLEAIQTDLNTLRAMIKDEIQNDAYTNVGENHDRTDG